MNQMKRIFVKYALFIFCIISVISIYILPPKCGFAAVLAAPSKISDIFPDPNFAMTVAGALGLNSNDTVTQNDLNNITSLNAMDAGIKDITGIGYLANIQSADLSYNQIEVIPPEIGDLTSLGYLSLSFNQISNIPMEIGKLTKLNYLMLDNNLITNIISGSLVSLNNLKLINISYNSIQDLSEVEKLPSSVSKNCLGQNDKIIIPDYFEANPSITQKIVMPEIYINNSAAVLSGSCVINTDKTSINVPVKNLGLNIVKLSLTNGLGKNTMIEIDYTVKDTTPPSPPVINPLLNNSIGNSQKPVINGTAEAGSQITVYINGAAVTTGSTVADPTGKWSYTPAANLNVGQNILSATATDASNNTSVPSNNTTIKIDITLSNTPVIDSSLNNSATANSRPVIFGTAISYSVITISVDGVDDTNSVTADVNGNWSFIPTKALSDGKHNFTARPKGAAKNSAVISSLVTLTVKTKAPVQPVIDAKLNNSVTNIAVPVISGTAEANSKISLHIDSSDYANCAFTSSTGKWSYVPASGLSEGKHTIAARATDAANNTSIYSNAASITIDTTPPGTPIIDTSLNNILINNSKPTIFGTAEMNSKITIIVDGAPLANPVSADSTGKWKYTPSSALLEGRHVITAKAADGAGNVSGYGVPVTLTIDVTPPNMPIITMPVNNTATNVSLPLIRGTTDPNTAVIVGIDSQYSTLKIIPDAVGNWSYSPLAALSDGLHKITAKAIDTANNMSAACAAVNITIVLKAPTKPIIDPKLNNFITNNSKPTIYGTADASAKISISIDNASVLTDCATADSTGKWSYTLTNALADGKHTISAMARNIFYVASDYSTADTVTVDTVPPAAPVIDISFINSILNSQKPTITGTAEAGTKVIFTIDGVEDTKNLSSTDSSLRFKYTPSVNLPEGLHNIMARAMDAASNKSSSTAVYQIIINTTPPNVPRITTPVNDTVSNNSKPVISGIADFNTAIIVTIDGTDSKIQILTDNTGKWSYTPDTNISDGKHKISAKAKNSVNNISTSSDSVNITIDATPPKSPVINIPVANSITSDQKLIVSGTAEAKSRISLNIDGTQYNDIVTVDSSGKWNYVHPVLLTVGKHTITAKAKDSLNNESLPCPAVAVNIDLTAPSVSIASPGNKDLINDASPVISGTSKRDSRIILTIDGKDTTVPIIADSDGNWSYKCSVKLVEGNHLITARAKDPANNQSVVNPSITFTIDTTPPSPPIITAPAEKIIQTDSDVELDGTAEPNSLLTFIIDGNELDDAANADENGKWSFAPGFGSGKHSVVVKAKDSAGNMSTAQNLNFEIESVSTPVIKDPVNAAVISDQRPSISGTGDPNSNIMILVDNVKVNDKITADPKGNWSYKIAKDLESGKHIITISASNNLNMVSPQSIVTITVNAIKKTQVKQQPAPNKLSIKSPVNNLSTRNKRVAITGTANPNSKLILTLKIGKAAIVSSLKADKSGKWGYNPQKDLKPGKYIVSIKDTNSKIKSPYNSSSMSLNIIK